MHWMASKSHTAPFHVKTAPATTAHARQAHARVIQVGLALSAPHPHAPTTAHSMACVPTTRAGVSATTGMRGWRAATIPQRHIGRP